ncbi:MAG: NUDIX hydrolase [Deltaproteobacteria bacterium]|nr:NUDIX hydrolase [Deltaproteobacteria bacterium]MBW2413212.1 NUDIX hydrolase [Deltaproteobacteria bacterium]
MPVQPLPASTVILIRDGSRSPEVLMLERHGKSDFLPDMYVFPGGRVEESDYALSDRVQGLTDRGAAALLTTVDPDHAMGFVVAAIRETWEESGILLASRRGSDQLIGGEHAAELSRHRLEVQAGSRSFRDLVESEDLILAADRLAVHGHWITPEAVPRRFDTLFFATLAPPGQLAAHDGVESTDHVWTRPENALEQGREGKLRIIFPTACTLETLVGFDTAEAALAAARERPVVPCLPVFVEKDGERRLTIPEEAGYPRSYEVVGRESG